MALALERDGLDDRALHLLAVDPHGRAIGTLRLLFCADAARIGRVAVTAGWRRMGVAGAMLEQALATADARGCREARLAAQLEATGLYRRAGFTVISEPFEEAGIPHVWMRRALAKGAVAGG